MRSQKQPLDVLEEQRAFCLSNFISAVDRSRILKKGSDERKRACDLVVRTLEALAEIEDIEMKY